MALTLHMQFWTSNVASTINHRRADGIQSYHMWRWSQWYVSGFAPDSVPEMLSHSQGIIALQRWRHLVAVSSNMIPTLHYDAARLSMHHSAVCWQAGICWVVPMRGAEHHTTGLGERGLKSWCPDRLAGHCADGQGSTSQSSEETKPTAFSI